MRYINKAISFALCMVIVMTLPHYTASGVNGKKDLELIRFAPKAKSHAGLEAPADSLLNEPMASGEEMVGEETAGQRRDEEPPPPTETEPYNTNGGDFSQGQRENHENINHIENPREEPEEEPGEEIKEEPEEEPGEEIKEEPGEELGEGLGALYDPQPESLEEVAALIRAYEEVPPEERVKPYWQYQVEQSMMPLKYHCGIVENDELFSAPYYTFFIIADADSLATAVPVSDNNSFIQALRGKATEIKLTQSFTVTSSLIASAETYIDRSLTIYGQGNVLTLGAYAFYFRLTGTGRLKIYDLEINREGNPLAHCFSVYHTVPNANILWTAEFENFKFTGGGLIGPYYDTGSYGKLGSVVFKGNTAITSDRNWGLKSGVVHSHGQITFEGSAQLSFQYTIGYTKPIICAEGDIVFLQDMSSVTYDYAGYFGLFWSNNGSIYFNGKTDISSIQTSGLYYYGQYAYIYAPEGNIGFYSETTLYFVGNNYNTIPMASISPYVGQIYAGTVAFHGDTQITANEFANTYSPAYNPIITADILLFYGNKTDVSLSCTYRSREEYGLFYAASVEIGNQNAKGAVEGAVFTMKGRIQSSYFKSPNLGSFTVHPHTILTLERDLKVASSLYSTRDVMNGYEYFFFETGSDISITGAGDRFSANNGAGGTALIRSDCARVFWVGEGANMNLTVASDASGENGQNALILKKPDAGDLLFTVSKGSTLTASAAGTYPVLHGACPILILGDSGQPDSTSTVYIYGTLRTNSKNGNGWGYEFSVGAKSGKDTFIVDGGAVYLNADGGMVRSTDSDTVSPSTAQYAAFDNYSNNDLDLIVENGGLMNSKSNGWRAMSLAGGAVLNKAGNGDKRLIVRGGGVNNATGSYSASTLQLEGGQFAIAAEAYSSLYVDVSQGGKFIAQNTQDSTIYTRGTAVYTVTDSGSEIILIKTGQAADKSNMYSLYGVIFHDLPTGPLQINVLNGGHMRVECSYGTRAAICAQTNTPAYNVRHSVLVKGEGSYLEVINNNKQYALYEFLGDTKIIVDDALYPLGAVSFAANTSGSIFVEDGGNFYAESHNPLCPTLALGGYQNTGWGSGKVVLNNPGWVDIRNDSANSGDIRAIAIRGKTNYAQDVLTYYTPGSGLWYTGSKTANFTDNTETFEVIGADVSVYKIDGSKGTLSYTEWNEPSLVRQWMNLTISPGSYNVGALSVDNSGVNGSTVGENDPEFGSPNTFALHKYGRITAGAATRGGYKVTYDGNGGKTAANELQYNGGVYSPNAVHKVMDNGVVGFEKRNAAFKLWNTKPDGTGEWYQPGDEIKVLSDITLYAVWEIRLDFIFYKVSAISPHTALEGVKFTLYACGHIHDAACGGLNNFSFCTHIHSEMRETGSCWVWYGNAESDGGGRVIFEALAEGEYQLVETQTLLDYRLPKEQWRVIVDGTRESVTLETKGTDKPILLNDPDRLLIGNLPRFALPNTGGDGNNPYWKWGWRLICLGALWVGFAVRRIGKTGS